MGERSPRLPKHTTGIYGTCPACGDQWIVRFDGTLRRHGLYRGRWCEGSLGLPREGVLMGCIWCGGIFISEDENHRFCSEDCVQEWTDSDGTWDGWETALLAWLTEKGRAHRGR